MLWCPLWDSRVSPYCVIAMEMWCSYLFPPPSFPTPRVSFLSLIPSRVTIFIWTDWPREPISFSLEKGCASWCHFLRFLQEKSLRYRESRKRDINVRRNNHQFTFIYISGESVKSNQVLLSIYGLLEAAATATPYIKATIYLASLQ